MKIGFDFDNTIIDYSNIFYEIGKINNLIPENINTSKSSVKSYLHSIGKEKEFTTIQGLVYGKEILKAKPAKNILEILKYLKKLNHDLYIVSHKTKYPFQGEKINLRDSANSWIEKFLRIDNETIFNYENIFYEDTIEKKVERIEKLEICYFIDDLISIINLIKSPTIGILYDPNYLINKKNPKIINDHLDFKKIIT